MIFSHKFNLVELKFHRVTLHYKSQSTTFLYCDNVIGRVQNNNHKEQ